jgi:deoxyribodipyrimidine photo-lyase
MMNQQCNALRRGMQYDEEAQLAAAWVPELAGLPPALRHAPWIANEVELQAAGVTLGVTYPHPIMNPADQTGKLKPKNGKAEGSASPQRRRGNRRKNDDRTDV